MPKKSKKQKIRAYEYFQATMERVPEEIRNEVKTISYELSHEDTLTTRYFMIDLKKSLLLISGIIALEILLYFASMSTAWFKLFRF